MLFFFSTKATNRKEIDVRQPWLFIGRIDAEAEAPICWLPDAKIWLTRKDPDAGKDWGQEEKRVTKGEMVGWHYQLNEREFEQTPEDGEGQGSLAYCSPWGHKESDITDWTTTLPIGQDFSSPLSPPCPQGSFESSSMKHLWPTSTEACYPHGTCNINWQHRISVVV